jgi:Predicted membrane protein
MTGLGRHARSLAVMLALTAGFVDAVGFLELGGFFLSFMSGNTTRLGTGLAAGEWPNVARAAFLIVAFVVGVGLASLVPEGRRFRQGLLLLSVALLMAGAAALTPRLPNLAVALAAMGMGALNIVFQKDGDIAFGVTYMTGGLVRIGVRVARALRGGPRWSFMPFLMLWVAMATGAVVGALCQHRFGGGAFWLAAAACLAMAAFASAVERSDWPD